MECAICGCFESEEKSKFFSIGRVKFIVCEECLNHSDPKTDFEDVKEVLRAWQNIKKKIKL